MTRVGIIRAVALEPGKTDNYASRFLERGCEVVDLYPGGPPTTGGLDALVLSGGEDVDPRLYNEDVAPETDGPNRAYDDYEIALLHEALDARTPVLAICRGHQVLNVALGGSLLQHIPGDGHRAYAEAGELASRWHDVDVLPASLTHAIYGALRFEVNSRHHQGVTEGRIAPALTPTAWSPEGYVEALEAREPRGWLLGLQWHPERPEPQRPTHAAISARLFDAFVSVAQGVETGVVRASG